MTARVPVQHLRVSRPGLSRSRNEGLARAGGSIVAFTDDDVCPARDWVASIAAAMHQASADMLGGRIVPAWDHAPPAWLADRPALHHALTVLDHDRFAVVVTATQLPTIWGANMAFRRQVFDRVGGFDTRRGVRGTKLYRGEELDLVARALAVGVAPCTTRGWSYDTACGLTGCASRTSRACTSSARRGKRSSRSRWPPDTFSPRTSRWSSAAVAGSARSWAVGQTRSTAGSTPAPPSDTCAGPGCATSAGSRRACAPGWRHGGAEPRSRIGHRCRARPAWNGPGQKSRRNRGVANDVSDQCPIAVRIGLGDCCRLADRHHHICHGGPAARETT